MTEAPLNGLAITGFFTELAWLVPALPFAAFVVILFFGKKMSDRGHGVAIAAAAASLALATAGFLELAMGRAEVEKSWTWASLGDGFQLSFGMSYDFLAAVMFVVVTTVSLLVQIYSTGYMHGDARYTWYFAALSLFSGSMLLLVAADNLLLLFLGWEGVGVCSYFLIGHYWEDEENSSAAIKAFLTTRVGDIGLLFGIFVLFGAAGTFDIAALNLAAEEGEIAGVALTAGALLLFLGAAGKSAQFPLHVWLPNAMAGPTPVSALIHAATMVVAGVYLVARMFPLFESAPAALDVIAVVASVTMIMAALLALVQDDIKRVLAYSTISQLAYMMAALGVGAYTASIFHLFTNAFSKSLLFLAAGSAIHAVHSNDMSEMGGLRRYMPHTFRTFMIGALALVGIFPLSGFFSKDEIIGGALRAASEGTRATAWVVLLSALITSFLTALYMTRAVVKTFWGDYRGHGKPRESPGSMVTPLWVLAAASLSVGLLGLPIVGPFGDWITTPGERHYGFSTAYNLLLPAATLLIAGAAGWLGWQLFARRRWQVDLLGGPFAWVYELLRARFFIDDFYLLVVVRPIQYRLARAAAWADRHMLDGVVHGTAGGVLTASRATEQVDRNVIDLAVNQTAGLMGWTGGVLRYIQSGNVQRYAAVLFASIVAFVVAFALLQ